MDDGVHGQTRVADWVDVAELDVNPYPSYARLRREGPVMWVPALGRYVTASYDSGVGVEEDPETFTAWEPEGRSTMLRTMHGRPMNRKDDPEHRDDRRAADPSLKPRAITESWLRVFEQNAQRHLDTLVEAGPGANLMEAFAAPYAADNLCQILGLVNVQPVDMGRWSHDLVAGIGNVTDDPAVWERSERSNAEIDVAIAEMVPRYRLESDHTMLSGLLRSGIPFEDVAATIKLTISGGMNEPQNVTGASVYALLTHPRERERVESGAVDYGAVFEEALRWETPIGMFPRTVTRDAEYFGARLRAGEKISVLTGAANHDEEVFTRPTEFLLDRPQTRPHFAFGRGTHMCAGMWVARASVGRVALPAIFRRLEGLTLSAEREPILQGWVFRGLKDLPVSWRSVREG